ncbi:diguanylate cyclase [Candidatus Fermentibacteria bacterium]|nr:diguanylate cyclase [Candidatus Fermentibacteria bacterium]
MVIGNHSLSLRHERASAMLAKFRVPAGDELAYVDDLTGLPNRRFLDRALDELIRRTDGFWLLFVDLDNFKAVNDNHGHAEGDRVIQRFADLLVSSIRGDDLVARHGGDEFVVIVKGGDAAAGGTIAARIVRAAAANLQPLWSVSASLGVARFPTDAQNKQGLLTMADRAMYAAKASGRACWRHASSEGAALYWHEDVFVGREREVAWLSERLVPTAANTLTIVTGESGMGKSTLLERVVGIVPDHIRVLRMACTPELSSVPYAPLVSTLREGCARFGVPPMNHAWSRVLSAILPDVFPESDPVTQPFERVVVLQAISSLMQGWAPVTLVVTDGHLVDRETAEVLVYLYQVGLPRQLALCCTIEGEPGAAEGPVGMLTGMAGVVAHDLAPLQRGQVSDLIGQRLGAVASEDLTDAVFRASGGNPLIANEVVRALLETGELSGEGVGVVLETMPALLSERVRLLAAEKLVGLSDDERLILLHAAMAEGEFDLGMLRTLTGLGEGEILTVLDRARRRGLLRGNVTDPFTFAFANGVFRDEVARLSDAASRRRAHLAMANLLRHTDRHAARARHLERGGAWLEAVRAYIQAARQSAAKLLPQVSLHYLTLAERIRERMPKDSIPSAEVEALWSDLAHSLYECNLLDESRVAHVRLASSCEEQGDSRRAHYHRLRAAVMLRIAGRYEQALAELEPLVEAADGSRKASTMLEQVDVLARLGRTDDANRVLRRALPLMMASIESEPGLWLRYHHARMLVATARGAFHSAKREAAKAARGIEDSPAAWWYFNDLAETCLFTGEPRRASRYFARGRAMAAAVPSIMGEIWTRLGLVSCDYHTAKPRQALEALDDAEKLIRRTDDAPALLAALVQRARICLDLGEIVLAWAAVESARGYGTRRELTDYAASLCALADGDPAEALLLVTSALEALRSRATPLALTSGIHITEVDLELHREELIALMGDTRGVRERLEPRIASFYPRARLRAQGLLAQCAHREGEDETAEALYREALTARYGQQEARERNLLVKAWGAWSPQACLPKRRERAPRTSL